MPADGETTATMLTKLTVRNFKQFEDVTVELDNVVVFVGPNDSGKTTALQALALWELGLRRWRERSGGQSRQRGVSINRLDLLSVPVGHSNLLWRGLKTREGTNKNGKSGTANIRIEIVVDGVSEAGDPWTCGLEFDYVNRESFYCRPLRIAGSNEQMPIPEAAGQERVAFLPPMSGLSAAEPMLQPGRVNVLLGEGRTAEVLRNLCLNVFEERRDSWDTVLVPRMEQIFGATIQEPKHNVERGEIMVSYKDARISSHQLDLSSSGRGFQQTLLLTAYMLLHPNSVILLDEPDAHLEILRQRQIYQAISETAQQQGSQLIIATHSEVVLNEATNRHTVTAFVGTPHRIDGHASQVLKALSAIGYEQYVQAEQTGWVLYLEGSTDLAILRAFARTLQHPAEHALERPFVHYVGNQPRHAEDHFWGLREARNSLLGFALFDRLSLPDSFRAGSPLSAHAWAKREIENYFCRPAVLERWAEADPDGPLFSNLMVEAITEVENALLTVNLGSPWDGDLNVSEQFLPPVFKAYYEKLGRFNTMSKSSYHTLVTHIEPSDIDPEVISVLDDIARVAANANIPS